MHKIYCRYESIWTFCYRYFYATKLIQAEFYKLLVDKWYTIEWQY